MNKILNKTIRNVLFSAYGYLENFQNFFVQVQTLERRADVAGNINVEFREYYVNVGYLPVGLQKYGADDSFLSEIRARGISLSVVHNNVVQTEILKLAYDKERGR